MKTFHHSKHHFYITIPVFLGVTDEINKYALILEINFRDQKFLSLIIGVLKFCKVSEI